MKKMIDPIDIAKVTLFLVSPSARHITAAVLPVDSGWLTDGGRTAYKQKACLKGGE